jgi:hypothetical protein
VTDSVCSHANINFSATIGIFKTMQTRTNIVISCLVGLAIVSILALRGTPEEPPPARGMERIPASESATIAALVASFKSGDQSTWRRQQACASATFTVIENLPPDLTQGLFQPGIEYAASVGFSRTANSESEPNRAAFGLSIKLHGVSGNTLSAADSGTASHDLVLAGENNFAFADPAALASAVANGRTDVASSTLVDAIGQKSTPAALEQRWWSVVPYRFGPHRAVKYGLRACPTAPVAELHGASDEDFPDLIYQSIGRTAMCYEFMLQFQTDPAHTPIENANVAWDELLAPFEPVAVLQIPVQRTDSPEHAKACEELSFDPWRALPVHAPLGGINRLQRALHASTRSIQ